MEQELGEDRIGRVAASLDDLTNDIAQLRELIAALSVLRPAAA